MKERNQQLFAEEDLQMANAHTQSFTPSNPPCSVPHATSEQQTKTKTRANPESLCHQGLSGSAGWKAECRLSLEMRCQLNGCSPRPAATALLGVYPRDPKTRSTQVMVDVHSNLVCSNSIQKGPKHPFQEAWRANSGTSTPHKHTATAQDKP